METKKDYHRASAMVNQLLDEIGKDETHPLAELLDYFGSQIAAYEDAQVEIPEAAPNEVSRFLMDQNGYSQSDLADCAPQSRISEILSGKREISKELAKALANKFAVNVGVFV